MSETTGFYQELTCMPLHTYEEILEFLENPPPWRTLCTDLRPHSDQAIKNIDINKGFGRTFLETPQTFCHYNPDTENNVVERHDVKKLPKTLVCHDMANGYHDDSFIDGTSNYEAYTFYNWGGIDIFCYFSHHLVTIPPLGWINVGHAHGVKVIGTLITEWGEGAVFWDNILDSGEKMQNFASALVAIAKTLKFDGWLLNVENKISKPDKLIEFVRLLHAVLHQELVDPVLLWYDSVTVGGHLNWQNCLNEKNRAFFEACDGIFTNYSWSEGDVSASVAAAGDRVADVYIGIDVWGRNFYGGGQFNTQEAVKLAHAFGCSLAIFAPAWTHEALADESCDVLLATGISNYRLFLLRERAFWTSLWPFLSTKLPCQLPFATSFCRGQGLKRRLYGEVICPGPWYNLRHMHYQPNSSHGPHGYLLSVLENILAASKHGFLNKVGIIRCRRSLEQTRSGMPSKDSKEVSQEKIIEKVDEEVKDSTPEEDIKDNQLEPRSTKTRKVSDVFKNLFKIKFSKEVEEHESEEHEAEEQQEEDKSSTSLHQDSDRSMIQTSVNLRLGQNTKKIRLALAPVPDERECLEPYFEDSFNGGSCLKVNPSDKVYTEHRRIRLFHTDFRFGKILIVCVATKNLPSAPDQILNIELQAIAPNEQLFKIVLIGSGKVNIEREFGVLNVFPVVTSEPGFRDIQKYLLLNEPGFYVPVENGFGWQVRYYAVEVPELRVLSVDCRTTHSEGPILLGHFGLCQRCEDTEG